MGRGRGSRKGEGRCGRGVKDMKKPRRCGEVRVVQPFLVATGSLFSFREDPVNGPARKVFWLMARPRAAPSHVSACSGKTSRKAYFAVAWMQPSSPFTAAGPRWILTIFPTLVGRGHPLRRCARIALLDHRPRTRAGHTPFRRHRAGGYPKGSSSMLSGRHWMYEKNTPGLHACGAGKGSLAGSKGILPFSRADARPFRSPSRPRFPAACTNGRAWPFRPPPSYMCRRLSLCFPFPGYSMKHPEPHEGDEPCTCFVRAF